MTMQNTGTWDSDLAIIFLMCLMAPIAFHFLGALLQGMSSEPSQDEPARVNPSPPRQVYPFFPAPTSVDISVSIPDLKESNPTERPSRGSSKRPKRRPKRTTKPKKKNPAPASPKPLTDRAVVLNAVSGLCSLGYKKGDATKIVKSISDKKKYDSVESLVKDCFMCIS
jgi:hypothetical protein